MTFVPTRSRRPRSNRGFTLIELLVVIAILGIMATVGTAGISAGRSRSRLAGATRDVLAAMRQARAIALITQKPSLIIYSNSQVDDENVARVEVKTQPLFAADDEGGTVYTLGGDPVVDEDGPARRPGSGHARAVNSDDPENRGVAGELEEGGETLSDHLSPKISLEVTRGLRIKVLKGELLPVSQEKVYKSSISVFSTTDYIKSSYEEKKTAKPAEEPKSGAGTPAADAAEDDGPVEVAWQTNGRTEPHTVYIYPEGSVPEKGLSIEVDKFGDCQVSQWKEDR